MLFYDVMLENTSKDANQCCVHMGLVIAHLLKFKYIQNKQTVSWIDTITTELSNCKDLIRNKSVYNKVKYDNDLKQKVINKVISSLNHDKNDLRLFDIDNNMNLFDIDFITDDYQIKQFLLEYINQNTRDYDRIMNYIDRKL